jgi:GTP-binding protein Era
MKSGFVAIVGRPNVGKSTLLNKFLGTKLVAVTPKPQTTRHNILGILSESDYQIIFTDTPGIFKPSYALQKVMVNRAISTLKDTDITLLLVEPFTFEEELVNKLSSPTVLAINKIDLLKDRKKLLPLIDKYKDFKLIQEIVPISALYGEEVERLKNVLIKLLPEQESYYPGDILSDKPERFFVSEIIREKIFLSYGQEIPYSTTVVIDEFKERERGKYFIRAIIYVERRSEKSIIIGKKGKAIREVGVSARKEIERMINHPVYLELWVKVRKGWRRDLQALKEFGYE